ncbi:hypothetical protein PanWU01x14_054850 [Parasponia andersonii]|uniref:Uncharacterized protein n=1 Tax=Parasponia andersonii TaxID=3476 RepID=A0A2P5DL00_PARAD|nr:hypothetical protein PanWU01x14_054850 [Parasponia andersonii]
MDCFPAPRPNTPVMTLLGPVLSPKCIFILLNPLDAKRVVARQVAEGGGASEFEASAFDLEAVCAAFALEPSVIAS